jgi:ABC-type polysaccharide/polyol phosphate transport system ATPase subunit
MLMATNSMVEVERLSKLYARSPAAARRRAAGIFGGTLFGRPQPGVGRLRASEFWALREVGFCVERGEALGIIGLNGSGKTTLLRLLAGQLLPDDGEIRLAGIDFTAGFRMSATGQENIFLKGAMLGRSRAEMAAAFDGIVAFTELGDAISAPIFSYSTGMLMRLAFAINVASQPDILLIDETLAVGDFRFRQKCLARLRGLRERSCFILVSHSMGDIKRFCSRVIVLHQGRIAFEGEPEAAVAFYESMDVANETPEKRYEGILKPWIQNTEVVADLEHYWCDVDGRPINEIRSGETLYFQAAFTLDHVPRHLIMGIPVWTENGQYVTGFSTEVNGDRFHVEAGQRATFRLEVPDLAFNPGAYVSNFTLLDGPEFLVRAENPLLTVKGGTTPYWGVISLPYKWRYVDDALINFASVMGKVKRRL